jgi:hypothetical protein
LLNTTRFVTLEEVKNCKSLESYKYFVSGWVLKARWKVYICQELVLVSGRVRHSFSASKAPLEPWAIIRCNGAVLAGHCTCMAGLAETCSHVGALLYWVKSAVRILKETACTSQDDMWITPNPVEKVPYLQLRNNDFKPARQNPPPSNETTGGSGQSISEPSTNDMHDFFYAISQDSTKPVVLLSLIEPFIEQFVPCKKTSQHVYRESTAQTTMESHERIWKTLQRHTVIKLLHH